MVVLENKTGRILAMTGGFSYPLSQLNRATQCARQPGSALKPLTYLAALGKGLQPNTLVHDSPITLPPIGSDTRYARPKDYWSPRNYDGGGGGTMTLRQALENSRNLATAQLMAERHRDQRRKPASTGSASLRSRRSSTRECVRYYPFVLGAQPVRPIDLARFYAAIANEGVRPEPHVIESIEQRRQVIYRRRQTPSDADRIGRPRRVLPAQVHPAGRAAARHRRAIGRHLAPYVAGKTGTTDDENDAWFVGFTNDVTVAVWVGYDNADGKRRTLGGGATGGNVAVPIFEPIMEAVWAHHAPRTRCAARRPRRARSGAARVEDPVRRWLRRPGGRRPARATLVGVSAPRRPTAGPIDTQYRLVSRGDDQSRTTTIRVPAAGLNGLRRLRGPVSPFAALGDGSGRAGTAVAGAADGASRSSGR